LNLPRPEDRLRAESQPVYVSIRAPRFGSAFTSDQSFQSAPRPRGRGDEDIAKVRHHDMIERELNSWL
jgi:hypothetical protein